MEDVLRCMIYGVIVGFSEFTPVSASAHEAVVPMLLKSDRYLPLLSLFVHGGALGAILLLYRQRLNHLYQQLRLISLPEKKRNRPLDRAAVLDTRLLLTAAVPALVGSMLSAVVGKWTAGLLSMAIMLIVSGVAVYAPDYLPGGDRKARSMSPMEAAMLGLCAGLSVVCGLSAVGLMLAVGLIRRCDRNYILDICLMIVGIMLGGMVIVDLVRVIFSRFAGLSFSYILICILSALAAFGGGVGGIMTMRFLSVKTGFSGFAFYNWGLGLFCFIYYLIL